MKTLFLFMVSCLIAVCCMAQKSDTLITYNFGDNYAKSVAKATETYKVYKKDSVWIRATFNLKQSLTKMETFANRKLKTLNGEYVEYENDKVSLKGIYLSGKKTGLWTCFDPNGKQKESMVFHDGDLDGPYITYWKNGTAKVSENYVRGWKVGEKKILYENGNLALREIYDAKSKITDSTYLDVEGKPVTKADVITEPSFPGGMKQFYMYLAKSIRYPIEARNNRTQGKVYLSFMVNAFGKVEDIKVISAPSKSLSEEAIRVTQQSADWIPGTLFGNAVSLPYIMNINFTIN